MTNRILIVDDDADMRQMVSLLLRRPGYEIEAVSSGPEALEAIHTRRPDLVLLDVMMPAMDGHEVARRLRENPATSAIPIVMLTAKSLSVNRVEGILAGADDYLTKPVNPVELDQRVAAFLKKPESPRKPGDLLMDAALEAARALEVTVAWIFVADHKGRSLRSAAMSGSGGEESRQALMLGVKGGPGDLSFPLAPKISPLCDAVISGASWLDQPIAKVGELPGGDLLARGLEAAGVHIAVACGHDEYHTL